LTRLKAGLTNDEIQELVEKLRNSLPEEGQGNKE
jgi:Ca2+-binding EF-hand superfamily protein